MKKTVLFTILALTCLYSQSMAKYKTNPYTGKLDYYVDVMSTTTDHTQLTNIGTNSHAQIDAAIVRLNAVQLSTPTITETPDGTKFLRDDYSWQTISAVDTDVRKSTGVIQTQLNAVQLSTYTMAAISITTAQVSGITLYSQTTHNHDSAYAAASHNQAASTITDAVVDLQGVKVGTATVSLSCSGNAANTSNVSWTTDVLIAGSTTTFITYVSTFAVSKIVETGFNLSTATVLIDGGTSASVRFFIRNRNSIFTVTGSTPVFTAAISPGTTLTGGTFANVAVGVNDCVVAVVDSIVGSIRSMIFDVRGTR